MGKKRHANESDNDDNEKSLNGSSSPQKRSRRDEDDENDASNEQNNEIEHSSKRKRSSENGGEDKNGDRLSIKNINPSGKPAEAGIIQKVYVENFMCHRKLTVSLCRNVNFIHGKIFIECE